jgi:hypothetical protein
LREVTAHPPLELEDRQLAGYGVLDVIQQIGAKLGYGPLGRASDD